MHDRHTLFSIIRDRSFHQGAVFRLVSGRTSTIYFNLKPTMLDPEGARLIGAMVAARAAALGADYVGGLEPGAVPLVAATAAMSAVAGRPVSALFVRKKARGHSTGSMIEGLAADEDLAGRHVVVVEDVTTTGGSALKAIAALRQVGAHMVHVVTIVDREEGAEEAFAAQGVTMHALYRKSEFGSE